MDAKKPQQKLQSITKAMEAKFLKRGLLLLLLLLSLTILSFLLAYYSCTSTTSLLCNIHLFISRKAMFLCCNTILLFVIIDSGLLASSSSLDDLYDEFTAARSSHLRAAAQSETINIKTTQEEKSEAINIKTTQEEKAAVEGAGTLELVMVGEVMGVDDSGLVGVEDSEVLGADELNKRCEEFIERVKMERMKEAQQLVMVRLVA